MASLAEPSVMQSGTRYWSGSPPAYSTATMARDTVPSAKGTQSSSVVLRMPRDLPPNQRCFTRNSGNNLFSRSCRPSPRNTAFQSNALAT